jgi:hypothetical protein
MKPIEFLLFLVVCGVALALGILLYIERKKRTRWLAFSEAGVEILSSTAPDQSGKTISQPFPSGVEAVRFESTTGRSDFEVRIPSKKYMEAQSWQELELTDQSRDWLSPFLDKASEALKLSLLAQLASTQTFTIVFNGAGDLMRSKSGEGFRSILVDKHSHNIVSHGLLKPSNLTSANLLWECAAVIVGRKYLADIDRRLDRIDTGIAGIRAFLENERIGRLQADCKLLSDIADALRRDPSFLFRNSAVQHSVEAVEQNASAVIRACLLDLQNIREAVSQIGSLQAIANADLSPVSQAVSKAVHTLRAAAFALSLRVCCSSFLASHMDDDDLRTARLADVITLWRLLNEESKSMQVAIREKIDTLSETLSFETTVQAKKERAKFETREFFQIAASALKSTRDEASAAISERSLLGAAAAPVKLALTVNSDGRILTARVANHTT